MGTIWVPELIYLESEAQWIQHKLDLADELDGIALAIDWDKKEVTNVRYAKDN